MRNILILYTILALAFVFLSCSKKEITGDSNEEEFKISIIILPNDSVGHVISSHFNIISNIYSLTASPLIDGWEFVKWTGDLESFQNSLEIDLTKDIKLTAEFTNTLVPFLYEIETIVDNYQIIWGFDFLDTSQIIFGERNGGLHIFKNDAVIDLEGFPEIWSSGQGGLLDIIVHPDYKENGWIYAVYAGKNQDDSGNLNLVRFKVFNEQVTLLESLFIISEPNTWNGHYGSRIVFYDKYLFLSVGEGGVGSGGGVNTPNDNAQNINSQWGKIHRLYHDGSIPEDNPTFNGNPGPTSIFSLGHRNPQGLTLNPFNNQIWSTEHGPQGGDEINIIKAGLNYGWPVVSNGVNYGGGPIPDHSEFPDYEKPIYYWTPSIAVCDIKIMSNRNSQSWFRNVLVGGLKTNRIFRLKNDNGILTELEQIDFGSRVRTFKVHSDGSIYVALEGPGRIIKLTPIPNAN